MTFFNISDTDKFLNLVEESRGEVMLHLPDGSQLNLKENHTARQLLRIMHPGPSGLHISLSNSMDMPVFLRYMLESKVND